MQSLESIDLIEGIDHNPSYSGFKRRRQFHRRLVVPVQDEPVRRHSRCQCDMELSSGSHVKMHPLLVGQPRHR